MRAYSEWCQYDDEEYVPVIELLGLVIFATVVGIGLLDMKSGLSPFAMYRASTPTDLRRHPSTTGRPGDGSQSTPPAPAL
ncbi:MAG: hypothetical protein QOK35_2724 [Pseudonocardiales bacterium]|jgi:hypothetical protein|nr:hypothetical protein [Pseudonocardiales bacterium]